MDANGLEKICNDPKNRSLDRKNRIYVPFTDEVGYQYYLSVKEERPHLGLMIERLPEEITPEYVKSINALPGILSLGLRDESFKYPNLTLDITSKDDTHVTINGINGVDCYVIPTPDVKSKLSKESPKPPKELPSLTKHLRGIPFVVPGGRFNEMYGWDSYFESLGLMQDGRPELARGMLENFFYEIEHYNKILNANRSYYLTRSQPPFMTDLLIRVYDSLVQRKVLDDVKLAIWVMRGIKASVKELLGYI
jgi:alpha,alpha-trehalase